MRVVFIHGVPDTQHLWNPIRARLTDRKTIALALPGFGCPRPPGFSATKEAYVDFAIGEIERLGAPVDLVGHDWGANLVQRIVSARAGAYLGVRRHRRRQLPGTNSRQWQTGSRRADHGFTTARRFGVARATACRPPWPPGRSSGDMKDAISASIVQPLHRRRVAGGRRARHRPSLILWARAIRSATCASPPPRRARTVSSSVLQATALGPLQRPTRSPRC